MLCIFFTLLLLLCVCVLQRNHPLPRTLSVHDCVSGPYTLDINGKMFVDVADTRATQERGLSGRTSLAPDSGMLFQFSKPGHITFWMKEMLIPIDIIWLDSDLRVLSYVENATPDSYPTLYPSPGDTQFGLEVPAGFVHNRGVTIGATVSLLDCSVRR
jgi:uncharacterized protein